MTEQAQELANAIYDTLMQNTQFPQLNLDDVEYQELNASRGIIRFEYQGTSYRLTLQTESA
jgi:hypothetical protein